IEAMSCGYHVLCEKMMAASLDDFYRMKDASLKYGKVLLEAMRPAFDPAYEVIRGNLHRIGKIRRADLTFCQYSSRYDRFKAGILTNAFDPKMKNSALSDIGIYPLNIAVNLFGEPEDIISKSVFLDNGFEGEGTALLCYSDKLVSINYSKINGSDIPSVIEGEAGCIYIDKLTQPASVEIRLSKNEKEVIYKAKEANNMVYEIEAFGKMCKDGLNYLTYLDLTAKTQLLVDKIYKNSRIDNNF
ncbi:MAG: Gfo/Idh/MocA family oxidoreductase, partial [Clostridia bacterium]|nr:Gfo/Idh/MocA family oxidoreductase [Clostridia bacterium]